MSVAEFSEYLLNKFDEDVVNIIKNNKISGSIFLKLTECQLEQMIPAIGDVVELMGLQEELKTAEREVCTVCDLLKQ